MQRTINAPPPLIVERQQQPNAPTPAVGPAEPPSVLPAGGTASSDPVVPDLTGMSGRDAVRTLAMLGLPVQLVGHGMVTDQRPLPGTPVVAAVSARVWLDRRAPEAVPKAPGQ